MMKLQCILLKKCYLYMLKQVLLVLIPIKQIISLVVNNRSQVTKTYRRNHLKEKAPIQLTMVNLKGLNLIYQGSEKYSKLKINQSPEKSAEKGVYIALKRNQLMTNCFRFQKRSTKDDKRSFSDYKIKYGPLAQNNNKIQERDIGNNRERQPALIQNKLQTQNRNQIKKSYQQLRISIQNHSRQFVFEENQLWKIEKFSWENQEKKRNAKSKIESRKKEKYLRISHSFKNCNKFRADQLKKEDADITLDGWAIQLPLNDLYKKLDITDYTAKDEVKNFLSERPIRKEKQGEVKKMTFLVNNDLIIKFRRHNRRLNNTKRYRTCSSQGIKSQKDQMNFTPHIHELL